MRLCLVAENLRSTMLGSWILWIFFSATKKSIRARTDDLGLSRFFFYITVLLIVIETTALHILELTILCVRFLLASSN